MGFKVRSLTMDAKKSKMKAPSNAEREFFKALSSVAKQSAKIVNQHADGASLKSDSVMIKRLADYAKKIGPYAIEQSAKMLQQVQKKNAQEWAKQSKLLGRVLKTEVIESAVGETAMLLLHEQVGLITSIPIEAGFRAQQIAAKKFAEGLRASPDPSVIDQLVNEMGMTEEVATNRAKLIARTETARANSSFVQARATALESEGYIWRTTMDGAERHSHAKMNGKYVRWDRPPRLSDGTVGHAGTFPNCRCYPDPVLPDDY